MRAATPLEWLERQQERTEIYRAQIDGLATEALGAEVLALASLSYDGHTRELAVRHLGQIADPRCLLYVGPRACDWVEPVRQAAVEAIRKLLPTCTSRALVEVASVLEPWLLRRPHVEGHQVAAAIRTELSGSRHWDVLRAGRTSLDAAERVLATRSTLAEIVGDQQLVTAALDDTCDAVRKLVVEELAVRSATSSEPWVAGLVLRGNRVRVVRRFLAGCSEGFVATHREQVVELAMSQRAGIRRAARDALARIGESVLAQCKSRLQSARNLAAAQIPAAHIVGALLALGEVGDAQHASAVAPFVLGEDVRVRAAAEVARARLLGADVPRAVELMASEAAPLRRVARWMLLRLDRWRWAPSVRKLTQEHGTGKELEAVRTNALRALVVGAGRRSWEVLPDLLHALMHDAPSRDQNESRLQAWQRRTGIRGWLAPDDTTKEWLRELREEWRRDPLVGDPERSRVAQCVAYYFREHGSAD